VICLASGDGCNFIAESLCQIFRFFPGLLENPYGCTDEIFRAARNPQIFVEHEDIMLVQFAKILEKRRPDTRASALCKSSMDYNALSHVTGLHSTNLNASRLRPREAPVDCIKIQLFSGVIELRDRARLRASGCARRLDREARVGGESVVDYYVPSLACSLPERRRRPRSNCVVPPQVQCSVHPRTLVSPG